MRTPTADFCAPLIAFFLSAILLPVSLWAGSAPGYEAVKGKRAVTIMEGNRKVAVCRTELPNVEETKFVQKQEQIVIKSRGSHGPAVVQLFETRTGELKGRVLAYEIQDGKPAWAAGFEE